jgi:transcription antitermination factor NusG
MTKNWYLVYTKSQREKKVAALLHKKKINHYCPLNRVVKADRNWRKVSYEMLFDSFLFVNISSDQVAEVRHLDGVVNFVYWLGNPVVIAGRDVEKIQQFTARFSNISLGKIAVENGAGSTTQLDVLSEPGNSNGNELTKKHQYTLSLPSLGYVLTAAKEREANDVFNVGYSRFKLLS